MRLKIQSHFLFSIRWVFSVSNNPLKEIVPLLIFGMKLRLMKRNKISRDDVQ